jgi:hypothetical protein
MSITEEITHITNLLSFPHVYTDNDTQARISHLHTTSN